MTSRSVSARLLGLLAATFLLLAAPVAQAHAATYPPLGGPNVMVNTTSPVVGDQLTVSVTGFGPGTDVTFSLTSSSGAMGAAARGAGRVGSMASAPSACPDASACVVTADSAGAASASMKVTIAGPLKVTVSGVDAAGATVSKSMTVNAVAAASGSTKATDPSGSELVDTGATRTLQLFGLGVALVLLGAVTYSTVRRRRHAEAHV